MTKIPREALHHQIHSTSRVISKASDKGVPSIMRPPFGIYSLLIYNVMIIHFSNFIYLQILKEILIFKLMNI
jgi:hypothetical protein